MKPALDLGRAILASMKHVEATLLVVFERTADAFGHSKKETADQILQQLDQARDAAKKELADLFQQVNEGSPKIEITTEVSSHSHFFASLIEVCNHTKRTSNG
jgi:peptidoglycan hydrolase CwlO-like protein